MDILGGKRSLWQGVRLKGDGVRIGYFTQDLAQSLPMDVTALDYLYSTASAADPSITQETARSTLGAIGLSGDTAIRKIKDLSGGEKAKVSFAAFVLKPCNLLLLDEPSNHIDSYALIALSKALVKFDGALVVVSHDREFCRAIAPTHTIQVAGGKVEKPEKCLYLSDALFDKATAKHNELMDAEQDSNRLGNGANVKQEAKMKQKLTYVEQKEKQKASRRIMKIISIIEKKECEIQNLEKEMCSLGSDLQELMAVNESKCKLEDDIEKLTEEWEELELKYCTD